MKRITDKQRLEWLMRTWVGRTHNGRLTACRLCQEDIITRKIVDRLMKQEFKLDEKGTR